MATNISVNFPENGGPTVDRDTEAVLGGDGVLWEVKSSHPKIESVEIVFDGGVKYFSGNDRITKDLDNGFVAVWGQSPLISDTSATREDKYTLRGLDKNGDAITEYDPMIVTVRQ